VETVFAVVVVTCVVVVACVVVGAESAPAASGVRPSTAPATRRLLLWEMF